MKIQNPRKILISGGWGYANLGDDAILISTIDLVREKYKEAEITVMTFNPIETKRMVTDTNIKVVKSIHRELSKDISFKRLRVSKDPNNVNCYSQRELTSFENLYRKFEFKISNVLSYVKFKIYSKYPQLTSSAKYFKNVDLFIQAGGGYFIEQWKDSLYSRVLELNIANRFRVKTLVIGQSIGPFDNLKMRQIAISGLKHANVLSIRDVDSFTELSSYGLNPVLVPDTVLSQSNFGYNRKSTLAIILGSHLLQEKEMDIFLDALSQIPDDSVTEIKILVSRLWDPDIKNATYLYDRLKSNPNVKLIIPESYSQLQHELGECKLLISQNLHGLILAWRAGCACISINNKRKFISFMEQSGQSHRLSALNTLTTEKLLEFIKNGLLEDFSEMQVKRHTLSTKVRADFDSCLNGAWEN